jgi:hypothetical protein
MGALLARAHVVVLPDGTTSLTSDDLQQERSADAAISAMGKDLGGAIFDADSEASLTRTTPPGASCAKRPATPTASRNMASSCGTTPKPHRSRPPTRRRPRDHHRLARAQLLRYRFQMATDAEPRRHGRQRRGALPLGRDPHQFGAKDQRVSVHRDSLIQKGLIYLAADSSTTLCRFCRVPA